MIKSIDEHMLKWWMITVVLAIDTSTTTLMILHLSIRKH